MLREVDTALQALFEARMKTLMPVVGDATGHIGIQPPDGDWITDFGHFAPPRGLNVYLVEVREDRKLRSNERLERAANGVVYRDPSPMRVDCHYLISAWSKSTDRKERTLVEHGILAEALAVLVETRAITVSGLELPTTIAPPEGFLKLAEFWGTMGSTEPWRPVVELVVTVPIQTTSEFAGTEVTTLLSQYRPGFRPDGAETVVDIGGHVLGPGGVAIGRAWVRLETPGGDLLQTTTTDDLGRFVFERLGVRPYVLRAGAAGIWADPKTFAVPSPTDKYDLQLHV